MDCCIALRFVSGYCDWMQRRETGVFNDYKDENPEENTVAYAKLVEPYVVTALFSVEEDKCVGSGLYQKICTAEAIQMQDRKPVWVKDHCNICLACINRCPKEAIQYTDKSQNVFRYTFSKYSKLAAKNG